MVRCIATYSLVSNSSFNQNSTIETRLLKFNNELLCSLATYPRYVTAQEIAGLVHYKLADCMNEGVRCQRKLARIPLSELLCR